MSKVRKIKSKSKSKSKSDEVDTGNNNNQRRIRVEDENEPIPFQRLESPRPPSPTNANTNTNANTDASDLASDIDNDEPEPFASLDYDMESSQEREDDNDNENENDNLRPPSQNSIASVIKHSFQEAKQMMNLCGVGVGANQYQYEYGNGNGEIPDSYQRDLPLKFLSTANAVPYEDSIPSRTHTTSSSSLSTHFDKHKQQSEKKKIEKRRSKLQQQQQKQQQQQQQQQQHWDAEKKFPMSIYQSSSPTLKESNTHTLAPNNTTIIPLRHSQSVPFKTTGAEPMSHLFMRRSASTPATFKIGRGRSAFGKVGGNNSSFRKRGGNFTSPAMKTSANASTSKPTAKATPTPTHTTSKSDSSKCQTNSNASKNPTNNQTPLNSIALVTPDKRESSNQTLTSNTIKPEVTIIPKDEVSVTSNEDISSVTSSSIIMNSKTQRKIKERRKEKRKKQRESSESRKESQQQQRQQSNKALNESNSLHQKSEENMKGICNELKTFEDPDDKSLQNAFGNLHCKDNEEGKGNISYLSLEAEICQTSIDKEDYNHVIDEAGPVNFAYDFSDKIFPKPVLRQAESPPIPPPVYHKIMDDDLPSPNYLNSNPPKPLPHIRRIFKTPASPVGRVATPPTQTRLILPHRPKGSMSPCSHDSASYSRTTSRSGQSFNTSSQTLSTCISGNVSCNRSVTSSVAEADREVRDANRRELRRREGVDLDGSMSIQSSDTTSTNAYLALTSSPAQLRDGANIHFDRFFGCNSSIGPVNSQSSNASSVGWNHSQLNNSPGMNNKNRTSINVRSPITVSSNSIANNTNSSASTGEDPPRFVSCSPKVVPINSSRGDMPPRSDHHDSSMGYSKLGSSEVRRKSRSSSRSSSSKSSKSKSSRSKSKKKDKPRLYHKIGSAKVADQNSRALTPSPCNSYQMSPVKTPIAQFDYPSELVDVPKPRVRRHFPGSKMVLVSPNENNKKTQSFWSSRDQRAFQPTAILESVITPEKTCGEDYM